jgi:hypothetical protein
MSSQDDDADISTDEVVGTGKKIRENKASSFSALRSNLAQRSSKDSTTKEIFCT